MKALKIFAIILIGIITMTITSCGSEPKPVISADKTEVSVNETVKFTNASTNADAYEWDFGDETYSSEQSPSHSWNSVGTYTIKMTACKKQGHVPQRHFGGNPCKDPTIYIKVN
jgi:chitodextrinase